MRRRIRFDNRHSMNIRPAIPVTDKECLQRYAQGADAEAFQSVVGRYLTLVYSSALRRTRSETCAAEVTRAVFLVLARRAPKLPKKAVLAGWLFNVTAIACRKLKLKRATRWRWFRRAPRTADPPDATLWVQIGPGIDRALDRLPVRQRNAVLLCSFLNYDCQTAARVLRTRERRGQKRVKQGLKKIPRRLGNRSAPLDVETLASACAAEGCAPPVPESLLLDVLKSVEEAAGQRPSLKLARRTLATLAWQRWRRRMAIGIPSLIAVLAAMAGTAWYIDSLSGHSRLISAFLVWSVRHEGRTVPGLAQAARPWPTNAGNRPLDAAAIRSARDLYQTTNIWLAHLSFSPGQWKALQPKRIGALPHFLQPNGAALLRNPQRSEE